MKRLIIDNQKGFSLIEAMIAMVILSVGLLAVGLMQIGAMKANTNAISRTDGVAMAQSVLDTLRTLPVDDPLLSGSGDLGAGMPAGNNLPTDDEIDDADHSGDEIFMSNRVFGVNGQKYTIFWNVIENSPVADTRTVRVFVYWNDQKFGLNRTIMTSVVGGLYL